MRPVPALVFAAFASIAGCGPGLDSMLSQSTGTVTTGGDTGLYIALNNVPAKADATAFKLLAHAPGKQVDATSVRFCFAAKETCAAGSGPTVNGLLVEVQGRTVFVSEKFVRLTDGLKITALAKDASGGDLTTAITIVAKGGAATGTDADTTTVNVP